MKKLGYFRDENDDTIKGVYEIGKEKVIEISLLFNKKDKDVVCVPTHYFCNMGCKMCHLTKDGLHKPMVGIKKEELLEALSDILSNFKTQKRKLLISFMGVGEPLLNTSLIQELFLDEKKLKDLGYDYISYALSTMMPNNNLESFTEKIDKLNMPLKVHFSLHNPIDEERKKLIPSSTVKIEDALTMLISYKDRIRKNKKIMKNYTMFHRNDIPIEIHYTLIKSINDDEYKLRKLCELEKKFCIPIKFIKFNPKDLLNRSEREEIFVNELESLLPKGYVKQYTPPGRNVGSSCGEFTKHYYHSSIETKEEYFDFIKWKEKHLIKA